MNPGDDRIFYDAVILICAAMTLVNLARNKSRGASAFLLGGAFLVLGATVYAYTLHMPTFVLGIGGTVVFLLLVADVLFRIGRERNS